MKQDMNTRSAAILSEAVAQAEWLGHDSEAAALREQLADVEAQSGATPTKE